MRYFAILMLTLAACFGAQALALRAVGGRTAKSESNYYSSLGRIQAATVSPAEVMLLGGSITGRLPDRIHGYRGVANMGCDGGHAVDTLRAMDQGLLPTAPVLVIECNSLYRALEPKPSEVGLAMNRAWFGAGMRVPSISAYARPSAFFYSLLLARRMGDFGEPDPDGLRATGMPVRLEGPAPTVEDPAERALATELQALLMRLHGKGCRTIFVWYPPGRLGGFEPPSWIFSTIAGSHSEWWDLGVQAQPDLVVLTDGAHMAAPSAARTLVSLLKGIAQSGTR